jgi:cell division protein FtsQ
VTDPRIHERRVLVARQLGRRRRRRIVVAAVLVTLGLGGLALVHSSVFGAKNVEVSGDRHTPRAAVLRAAGLIGAPPLVDLDAAAIASRVDRLPWVASATVDISWPSTVSIRLKERVPVAAVQLAAGGFAICDPTGRVLEDVATRPPSLPLVATGGPVGPQASSKTDLVSVNIAHPCQDSLVDQDRLDRRPAPGEPRTQKAQRHSEGVRPEACEQASGGLG